MNFMFETVFTVFVSRMAKAKNIVSQSSIMDYIMIKSSIKKRNRNKSCLMRKKLICEG
jgi:hypothetical protein